MLFKVGRVAMKIAGRDAGNLCVIEKVQGNFVTIKGPNVRNKKCNIIHIEPLSDVIDMSGDIDKQLTEMINKLK